MVKKLTQDTVKKLRNRRNLRPSDRADLDYKMVKKLQSGLDELAGLHYIMNALPPEKIIPKKDKDNKGRKIGLKDKHVQLLFSLTETALRILDYKKIRGDSNNPYILEEFDRKTTGVNWQTGEHIKHGNFRRRKPKKEETERAVLLWEHTDYLKMLAPDFNPENPSDGGDRRGTDKMRSENIVDHQMRWADEKKIKELLASGVKDIEKIAKEVGLDSWDVWQIIYQIQENERKIWRLRQDVIDLKKDVAAIDRIETLSSKNIHPIAIAVDVNYPIEAVRTVINKMASEAPI